MTRDPEYAQRLEQYTLSELVDIERHIDQSAYPERYAMLKEELDRRQGILPASTVGAAPAPAAYAAAPAAVMATNSALDSAPDSAPSGAPGSAPAPQAPSSNPEPVYSAAPTAPQDPVPPPAALPTAPVAEEEPPRPAPPRPNAAPITIVTQSNPVRNAAAQPPPVKLKKRMRRGLRWGLGSVSVYLLLEWALSSFPQLQLPSTVWASMDWSSVSLVQAGWDYAAVQAIGWANLAWGSPMLYQQLIGALRDWSPIALPAMWLLAVVSPLRFVARLLLFVGGLAAVSLVVPVAIDVLGYGLHSLQPGALWQNVASGGLGLIALLGSLVGFHRRR